MDEVLTEVSLALRREPDAVGLREGVGLDVVGGVAIITLSTPGRHNVLTLAGWRRLADVVCGLEARLPVRVVVVRGAGGVFSAGADIKEFPEVRLDAADARSTTRPSPEPSEPCRTAPRPSSR